MNAGHHGPGLFVTRAIAVLAEGRRLVATSRRHRKGIAPHACAAEDVDRIPPTSPEAWRHLWAPGRLAWWIALGFAVGSGCFVVGGFAATWPAETLVPLRSGAAQNQIFFLGSLFFTAAAYLQLLEATNGDVAEALGPRRAGWRWFGWKPRNLGWLASLVQLVGTVAFNLSTGDALVAGLGAAEEDFLVWSPDLIGCVCFLISSALAWAEVSHGVWSFAPRSVSWWTCVVNLVGSVAFQLSAFDGFVRPGVPDPHSLWLAGFYTFVGAVCFLVGSYLLIPELFDGEAA